VFRDQLSSEKLRNLRFTVVIQVTCSKYHMKRGLFLTTIGGWSGDRWAGDTVGGELAEG
jgi:hypothetical protein